MNRPVHLTPRPLTRACRALCTGSATLRLSLLHLRPQRVHPAYGAIKRRTPASWMLAAWLVTWSPIFMANWWGPLFWHSGNLASIVFWLGIYSGAAQPYPRPKGFRLFPEGT